MDSENDQESFTPWGWSEKNNNLEPDGPEWLVRQEEWDIALSEEFKMIAKGFVLDSARASLYGCNSLLEYVELMLKHEEWQLARITQWLNTDTLILAKEDMANDNASEDELGEYIQFLEKAKKDSWPKLEREHKASVLFFKFKKRELLAGVKKVNNDIPEGLDLISAKGTDKIIYLHELGILDFLKEREPFNVSTRQLAIVLSRITGEKVSTLNSYLNPIYSKDAIQDNNPLEKQNNVERVRAILAGIGFKPK